MAKTSRILGPDGEPMRIERGELAERTARPTLVGFRRAQQWRSVVTGLTPERLRYILHAVAQGTWTPDFFELAEEMEERDLHYRGVLQQRRLAAAGAPMDVAPASDAARDRAIAEAVRADVLHGAGAHDARVDLLDAIGKGVACLEVVWTMRGARWVPQRYHRIDPRWLVFDTTDGETPYLIGERTAGAGAVTGPGQQWAQAAAPLTPGKFLYHRHRSKSGLPARSGLAYAAATLYLLKSTAVRDWWAYAEVFGLPVRLGKYGPNASDDDIQTLVNAIAMIASDAGAVIPDSMTVEFIQAARAGTSSGESVFEAMVGWVEAQVSKAVVGQTMTADDGSSLAQAQVHADVRDDLVDDDVRQLCDTLTDTLVAWYCALNFAPRPAGWPRIAPPADEDAVDVAQVAEAVRVGLRVEQVWLRERMGIPAPAEGAEVLGGVPLGAAAEPDDDEPGAPPAPAPPATALHAAEDPLDASAWLAGDLVGPVLEALDAAAGPEEFLRLSARLGVPEAFARDLALQCFIARVEGETEPER